jgi:hypothetical protein
MNENLKHILAARYGLVHSHESNAEEFVWHDTSSAATTDALNTLKGSVALWESAAGLSSMSSKARSDMPTPQRHRAGQRSTQRRRTRASRQRGRLTWL